MNEITRSILIRTLDATYDACNAIVSLSRTRSLTAAEADALSELHAARIEISVLLERADAARTPPRPAPWKAGPIPEVAT